MKQGLMAALGEQGAEKWPKINNVATQQFIVVAQVQEMRMLEMHLLR
ncbi:putative p44-29 outer membrane protein, silent [Anaplasma phagocytophilum str. CRT53-1]|uniref:Putative p44-29 outer membrane protein, silent n=1 Tax=Anaplasma phagocytophilum str. CRT53-1 TaxID=1359157 RepID=A0A0F3PL83_ANAPH|nr:putative p44-29 outer membrane protein, silent [Anaplasma phagocytophilum str. CRT53-1]